MADNKGSNKEKCKYEVKTSTSFHTYEFRWTVENFSQWPYTFKVTSEEFQPAKDIILFAAFEKFINDNLEYKCYMKLISRGITSFQIKLLNTIVGNDGKIFKDARYWTFTYDEQRQINSYEVDSNEIIEFSNSTEDQIVIFKLVLDICALTTKNVHRHLPKSPSDSLPTVIKHFKSMFSDSICTDLTLSVENRFFRVHKAVLCARSPVFAKMLKSPMDEKEKDLITIPDIDLTILKTFIEFLYSGDMPEAEFETACALYYAADKYEVPSLQKECANVLIDKLDVENSCQVLALANRHSDQELKELVLHFMQSEFDAILGTDSWIDFVHVETDLAVEVMRLRAQKFEKRSSS